MDKNVKNLKITILMPVYNGEKYLKEAIDSILDQTFKNFEFLIINDGSTDKTETIIKSYNDPRIRLLNNKKNIGITKSLNLGIMLSQGEYIARMDADDISLPNRLQKQYQFLENNKNIGVVGSNMYLINQSGKKVGRSSKSQKHFLIKWKCFIGFPMSHPTIMAKTKVLRANLYNENFISSQDVELWSRLIFDKNIKFANLNDYLFKHRLHPNSIIKKRPITQKEKSVEIIIKNIKKYINLSNKEEKIIKVVKMGKRLTIENIFNEIKIYKKLFYAYVKKDKLNKKQAGQIKFCSPKKLIKKYFRGKLNHVLSKMQKIIIWA